MNNRFEFSSAKKVKSLETKGDFVQFKAFCKIRPADDQYNNQLLVLDGNQSMQIIDPNDRYIHKSFKFDYIFEEKHSQEYLQLKVCDPLIQNVFQNIKSGLILTYGVSNSGKTFTVIGDQKNQGIIYFLVKKLIKIQQDLHSQISNSYFYQQNVPIKMDIYFEMFEIYNEEVFDLLSSSKQKLEVKQNFNCKPVIKNLSFKMISSFDDFENYLQIGLQNRSIDSTNQNQKSSRAHTIFNFAIELCYEHYKQTFYITVVDLAGSERQKKLDSKGIQYKESCKINSSLLVLDRCIQALKDQEKFVPYRDSKLTYLLQENFQNAFSIQMILNINPNFENRQEVLQSLVYASLFKEIKIQKPQIQEQDNLFKNIRIFEAKLLKQEQIISNESMMIENQKKILETNQFLLKIREFNYDSKIFHKNLFESAYDKLNQIYNSSIDHFDQLNECFYYPKQNEKSITQTRIAKKYIDQALSPIMFGINDHIDYLSQNIVNKNISYETCKEDIQIEFNLENKKKCKKRAIIHHRNSPIKTRLRTRKICK